MSQPDYVEVHTDGSCTRNPGGRGGWAFAIVENNKVVFSKSGTHPSTTNNRMELQAVISALEYLHDKNYLKVYSDSKYVINGISRWIYGWIKNDWVGKGHIGNGWKTNVIKNQDMWKHLLTLIEGKSIIWKWEAGHNENNKFNEVVDKLSRGKK